MTKKPSLFSVVGPGLLLAATGVGAGDLATASFAGSLLGTGILWVVLVGAFLKFVITEGLVRWQLATDTTLLEGVVSKVGRGFAWVFLPYLFLWSFFVASALMSACGVILQAMFPLFADPDRGKVAYGILSSLLGVSLVLVGGYNLFEKIMRVSIGIMFVTVVITAGFLWPGTAEVARGLVVPNIPDISGEGLTWTVALLGGIGGTVTILCYGYWIREEGRDGPEYLNACRIDVGMAYVMTAIFGIAMVIIGSTIEIEGGGATLFVNLSEQLADPLGQVGKWMFLIGAAGAVFSSLLGVWQAIPYLFADIWMLIRPAASPGGRSRIDSAVDTTSLPYRGYLIALALVPMMGLFWTFQEIQKLYAVVGALFVPLLSLGLLVLNGNSEWVGDRFRNRPVTVFALAITLVFFVWMAWRKFVA